VQCRLPAVTQFVSYRHSPRLFHSFGFYCWTVLFFLIAIVGHTHGTLLRTSHIVMPFFPCCRGDFMVVLDCILLLYYTHTSTHAYCLSFWYYGGKEIIRCNSCCNNLMRCGVLAFGKSTKQKEGDFYSSSVVGRDGRQTPRVDPL